jgi:hypothetical protein
MLFCPDKYDKSPIDVNKELELLKGELDDKECKLSLAKFFRRNIGFTTELLTGIKLAPYQIIIIKAMLNRNYGLCVFGRGCGKTFCAAMYCILQTIFEPNTNILLAGPTFRTSRFIFNHLETIFERPEARYFADCMGAKIRRNDEFRWNVNGGSIVAIPLNGEKIRGFRANVLVIDEFLLMSENMVEKVLMPFLVAPQDITRRLRVRDKETQLIRDGKMKEEEREVFENNAKMIALSSASYKCEYLYRKYDEYVKAIYAEESTKNGATYFVANLAWNAIPVEMIDKGIIELAQSNESNSAIFAREYGAQFIDGSDSYFSMNKMISCTIPDGEEPTLRLKGERDKKYIVSVDPNASNSPTSDDFAMCISELDEDGQGATVVHNFAQHGKDLKEYINYFYYILTNFNVEMICLDHAGGETFIDACNASEIFQRGKIEIKIFEFSAEKDGADLEQELQKARRGFNKEHQRIAFTQVFNTDSIRKMNEWLQGCIDFKRIWFGSPIKGNNTSFMKATGANLDLKLLSLAKEGENKGETISDFIDEQEALIKQVKYQCASIEVKTTAKGTQSFDLPQIMKRDTTANRMRKDSYTALLLNCWGIRNYHAIKSLPGDAEPESFVPFFIA